MNNSIPAMPVVISTMASLPIMANAGAAVTAIPPAQSSMPSTAVIIGALVLLALALLLVVRMLMGKNKRKGTPANPAAPAARKAPPVPAVPAGFDSAAFLRQAKASFVRMQAAWDKADTNDLSQFTTPQVFAELKAQMGGRAPSADTTEVVSIDAKLLGVDTVDSAWLASVKFEGKIKTGRDAPAEPFAEVWNMSRPTNGSSAWMLAGIQQLS